MLDQEKVMDAAERLVPLLREVDPNEAKKVGQQFAYFLYDERKMARYLGVMADNPPQRSRRTQGYYRRLREVWGREWQARDLKGADKARAWLWGVGLAAALSKLGPHPSAPGLQNRPSQGGVPQTADQPVREPEDSVRIVRAGERGAKDQEPREGAEVKGKVLRKEGMKVVFELEDGTQVSWAQYGYGQPVGAVVRLRVTKVVGGRVSGVRPM